MNMETTVRVFGKNQVKRAEKLDKNRKFWQELEFNRYGFVAMALLLQSCIGSIGVLYAVQLDGKLSMIILTIVVMANMAANAMCLAVAPMKVIVWFTSISVVISTIAIFIGIAVV